MNLIKRLCLVVCGLFAASTEASDDLSQFVQQVELFNDGNEHIRPLIESFRIAKSRQQWSSACERFGEYLLQRKNPVWRPIEMDPFSYATLDDAERYRNGDFLFDGVWYFLGSLFDYSEMAHGINWNTELNRHYRIARLAFVFQQTGDESFAQAAVEYLERWLSQAPELPDRSGNVPYHPFWQQLNTARRAGAIWPDIIHMLQGSRALTGQLGCRLARSLAQHARHMHRFPIHTYNVGMYQNMGMFYAGILLAEHSEAAEWRKAALAKVERLVEYDFYPDGTQIELAYGYGWSVLNNILKIRKLISANPFAEALSVRVLQKMEKFFDYTLYVAQPNGLVAPLNDSLAGGARDIVSVGADLFPNRVDFRWYASGVGSAPEYSSRAFPFAGMYAMRSDWTAEARYLHFDGGLYGYVHQHEDMNSILLSAFGRELLVEGGVHTYDPKPERRYTVSSFAHNTIAVDGFSQNRRDAGIESGTWVHTYPFESPLQNPWKSDENRDYVSAEYDFGYGPRRTRVNHRRSIVFVKPDAWVVFDRLTPQDLNAHQYEAFWHFNTGALKREANVIVSQNEDANLLLQPLSLLPLSVGVEKGRPERSDIPVWTPELLTSANLMQGWARVANVWQPVPTAIVGFNGIGPRTMATLLYAYRGLSAPKLLHFNYCDRNTQLDLQKNLAVADGCIRFCVLDKGCVTVTESGEVSRIP